MVQTTSHIFSGKVDIESNLLVGSSHLFVDTTNNRVGITTADPDASLHVSGNAYVESNVGVGSNIELDGDTGIITATEFRGDGSNLAGVLTSLQNATEQGSTSDATIQLTNADTSLVASGNVVISGNVTSLTFIGDGSQLTGVATNLQAITDNGNVTSNTVQFTNTGTSLTASGTIKAAAVQVNGLDVALDQDMTSNAGRIGVLETDLTSNAARVTDLEAANVVQEILITNLRTDLDSNAVRVSSLETDRTSNTLRISLLESANIIQETLITNLRTDVTSNTGRIADLETANGVQETLITDLRTDLDSNVVRVSSLETDRTSNTSRISVLESANTVQETLITNLRTDVTSNTGRISSLETDLTDNVIRITNLESADVTHASDISSLQSANTVQGGLITNLETATQYISATASGTVISSNLDVTGNIFMRGDRFIVESETKLINDAIIGIANNNTTSTTDVGIIMQRPTANVALIHHGGTNDFTIGYTQNDLEATDITNDTTNEINVNVLGNLYTQNNLTVGNVVTASAFVGDGSNLTGIATTLQAVSDNGNVTSNTIQFSNATTGFITTSNIEVGGNAVIDSNLDVHGSANVGPLTVSNTFSLSNVATIGTTKTFVVTVSNASGANKYYIDGDLQATIELHQNQTYIFDLSSSTLLTHPFVFQTTNSNDGTTNGTNYDTGITNTGTYGSDQKRTFVVPAGAPTTLYYYCTAHTGMGATISISPTAELIVSGRVVASGNVEASKFIGDGSQLTGISGATTSGLQVVTTNGATTSQAIQFTNTGTSLAASGAVTAASVSATGVVSGASVSATGGITAAYFTGDGSNVNIGEMTAETVPYVDSNKQLRDSHITRTADKTIITSNLEVTGNIFVSGNSYAINSENTVINDRIIGLANNNTSTTLDVGLMLQYPQKNVAMIHHGTTAGSPHNGQLTLGYTQSGFEVDNITKDPSNNLTLNVWGHVVTQNNITVGAQGSYYGDGTTLTGVALSADLTDNVTRISALETATIISNSSTITTGFTKGDIIYASADNVLNKLAVGGTDGYVLKVTSAANKTLGWAAETGGGGGGGSTPWVTNGNKIHYPTDNVGINVSDPAFKLDVHGTANVGALTATSLSVGGQTLALASDLTANATRVDALYTATAGDIIYADGTNSLAKLSIGSANQVLTVQGGLPAWVNASGGGGGGGGGSSQWSNVTLDEVYFDGNVGIANTNPGHDLSVGSNLFVDDDGSNVLVVTGNTAMSSLTLGQVSIAASYGLNDILNVSNTSSNIMQLTNATTGLVATGNVHALKFIGDGSGLTGITSNLDQIVNNGNVTSNTVQFSNAITSLTAASNVVVTGNVTADHFVGDGSLLTGITTIESNVDLIRNTNNTAFINLNSNVVTEFPRSKKLIKYPRVALTQNALNNGYTATSSTQESSSRAAWKVFNNAYAEGNGWRGTGTYSTSNGSFTGTWVDFSSGSQTISTPDRGDWLQIILPEKIRLEAIRLQPRNSPTTGGNPASYGRSEFIRNGAIWGSNDGSSWDKVYTINSGLPGSDTSIMTFDGINSTTAYNYFVLVITDTSGTSAGTLASFSEWELFGVPEYDPEAHGTDVVVKSYPNVPNTDWLEVYYDAKGLANGSTTVNDLKPVGTANNGTVGGNTSVTDEAFTFDGTGDYITSTVTTGTGNRSFSVACWFNFTTLGGLLWGFTGTTDGTDNSPSNNSTPHAYFNTTGSINFDFWAGATVTAENLIEPNRWYAGVWTYDGNARKIYIDGTQVNVPQSSTPLSIIDNTSRLSIGIYPTNLSGGPMTGSVANFRLFNRALSADEIYQLYAYQKQDFGHSTNNMTLKAGRLGIGTSEPRAALDVRGRIMREYNPGEIIETIQTRADGQNVRVLSGTYSIQNVTSLQDVTTSHTIVTGSSISYKPPPGTTRVIYEFYVYVRLKDSDVLIHFAGRLDGTQVSHTRSTFRSRDYEQEWVYNNMTITIGDVGSDDLANGKLASWTTNKTIDFTCRDYNSDYEAYLHGPEHWDGGGTSIKITPFIKITAIA